MRREIDSKEFWAHVDNAMNEKRTNAKVVCSECGLSYSSVMNAKSVGRIPSLLHIINIADYLDCSLDYLLLGRENINFPEELRNIAQLYVGFNDELKAKVLKAFTEALSEQLAKFVNVSSILQEDKKSVSGNITTRVS